jgi:hypothetical protein
MKNQVLRKALVLLSLVVIATLVAQAVAQPAQQGQGQGQRPGSMGIYGDWNIETQYGERTMNSILSFSRDRQSRELTGAWISFFGVTELKDVKFEDNALTFNQTVRFGDQENTSQFSGKLEEGKLTGTLKSDRGEGKVTGQRAQRAPRAVGSWEMKIKAGEREFTGTLVIAADKEGTLSGKWKSTRGETELKDLTYQRGQISFKRTFNAGADQRESTFEGTIEGNTMTGVFKSDRGESQGTGELIGSAAIGRWDLEIASDQGARKQRLTINPDMSGMYGAMPVEKITLEGDELSFEITLTFGEREFKTSLKGKIADGKLTGELTTSRGTQKVTGEKVIRTFNRANRPTPANN